MTNEATPRRSPWLWWTVGGLIVLFAIWVFWLASPWTGAGIHERMLDRLDSLELPDDLLLIRQETGGPSICFAGDCPRVDRLYASGRPLGEVCQDLQIALEQSGIQGASWRLGQDDLNPCTGGGRSGSYGVSVAVYDFERVTVESLPQPPPPDAQTAVWIEVSRR